MVCNLIANTCFRLARLNSRNRPLGKEVLVYHQAEANIVSLAYYPLGSDNESKDGSKEGSAGLYLDGLNPEIGLLYVLVIKKVLPRPLKD